MLIKLNLSEEEIRALNYERYHYPSPKTQKRLHAVYLKASKNLTNKEIGYLLDIHYNSVSTYIKLYKEGGIAEVCSTHYHPQASKLEVHGEDIIKDFNENPVCSINQAVSRIKDLTGIERKPTQVRNFLLRHGFQYRKMSAIPGKVDVEKQKQWLDKELAPAIEKAEKGEIELLFCDAAHFTLSAFLCMIWSQVKVYLKTSHGRNRINVLGAVNAMTKEVTTLINTSYITSQTVVEFMQQLKCRYAQKNITLVLDNARYQRCNFVMKTAVELNITLLFLPPYSPNLNIIERLWKFTKKQVLYAKYYDNADNFHLSIKDFFFNINNKYQSELKNLMTLKFQSFDSRKSQKYAA